MNHEHNPSSPFANGPAQNDAAENQSAENAATGTPIPSRFGEPLATMLPIPTKVGRPLPSTSSPAAGDEPVDYSDTFYGQIGGHETFKKLIHVFYQGIAADPLLRAMYVEEDLGPAEHRMLMFMEQYWGGPRTYLEERGHPRLRMRHVSFPITPEARDRWLAAMRKGVDAVELSPMHEATLWDYLERAAHSLVNAASEPRG